MGALVSTPALRSDWAALSTTYAVCSVLLHFIIKAPNFYALPAERPVEDEPIKNLLPIPKLMAYPVSETKRRRRIHANTVENCYLDFSFFWAALVMTFVQSISGRGQEEAQALNVLFILYTAGRAGWFFAYANAWQPWRTLFFALGQVSSLAATSVIVLSATRTDFTKFFPA